jgi:hypothetical protein
MLRTAFTDQFLARLNSATKYPSIPTYHQLDPVTGLHKEDTAHPYTGQVIITEKIDGANARIILLPGGHWFVGSREELLAASGDVLHNKSQGIVAALADLPQQLIGRQKQQITVVYGEAYGGGIGANWKQYSARNDVAGFRIFDILELWDWEALLAQDTTAIALWRENGGQPFEAFPTVVDYAERHDMRTVPVLGEVNAAWLPQTIPATLSWAREVAPRSAAWLSPSAQRRPEGLVLRSMTGGNLTKIRFQTYDRTTKMQQSLLK